MKQQISVFWFRRDLRLDDNVGFYHALQSGSQVLPIFIFDTEILDKLPTNDAKVSFFHGQLQKMNRELQSHFQSGIAMYLGDPISVFTQLLRRYRISSVFTNHDYEPYSIKRDAEIKQLLVEANIVFHSFKDQVIFEKNEVVKDDGNPYLVYTPYKKKWKAKFNPQNDLRDFDTYSNFENLYKSNDIPYLSLTDIGFRPSSILVSDYSVQSNLIENYEETRNFPAKESGTSLLGPHLRFGTVSIRKIVKKAIAEKNEVFWNELIWREFFMQILWHFPHTINKSFKPKYDRIVWRNNQKEFELWKAGKTGYPFVDAGIRELNATGYMHNRVRMIVSSFLCKHLLIDWRWGEAYFAEKLLDFDLASNVGNWQWAAGCGVDAAPYFRIFNPTTQMDKFDAQKAYIHKWVPELQELTYSAPIVDHKIARERCLKVYKEAVG
ncbi:deoxyribodipyrimidine photo-lyase [Flagellimonas sp. S3867]|uniref:cryptochrome/photolyase family protein n=1 Tax=Flagellimonas sp. S3867 TaxID=2768063 RepID=UPI0016870A8D|nr:deoxyribodipyrimidine photo-lyase [Flagellimonas sp. S3867]